MKGQDRLSFPEGQGEALAKGLGPPALPADEDGDEADEVDGLDIEEELELDEFGFTDALVEPEISDGNPGPDSEILAFDSPSEGNPRAAMHHGAADEDGECIEPIGSEAREDEGAEASPITPPKEQVPRSSAESQVTPPPSAPSRGHALETRATHGAPEVADVGASWAERFRQFVASRWARLIARDSTKMIGLGLAGTLVVTVWTLYEGAPSSEDRVSATRLRGATDPRGFPKIPVEGMNPLAEEDVRKMLARPPAPVPFGDVRAESEASPSVREVDGRVVLKPGMLADPEKGVIVLGPNGEGAAERGKGAERIASGTRAAPPRSGEVGGPGEHDAVEQAQFFAPGGLLEGAPTKAKSSREDEVLRLPVGERFKVRLEIGIASSVRQDVLARVAEDCVHDGRRVLKAGDIVKGRFSHDDQRVFVEFDRVLTQGRTLRLRASAVDGQMPGLRARRREATVEERSRARVASGALEGVAREAGNVIAGAAGPAGRIAERVAGDAVAEVTEDMAPDATWVLEVPAGRVFALVVTGEPS